MTEKFEILSEFIKDMSSETPDVESYLFVKDQISKYAPQAKLQEVTIQKDNHSHQLNIAQVLISKNVLEDRNQFINTTEALNGLISKNIIPVINENDVVATEELKFGDNDRLSAIVSILLKADKLVVITDKEGLFDSDPEKIEEAKKIENIEYNSEELNDLIPKSSSGKGMGGFSTKIMAAQMAGFSGIETQIISWSPNCINEVVKDSKIGTIITF